MDVKERLSKFLTEKRVEISKEKGYLPGKLITWEELAAMCGGIPAPTMHRWQDDRPGTSLPTYSNCMKMRQVFGDGIFEAAGYPRPMPDMDWKLRWILDHYDHGEVARAVEEIYNKYQGVANQTVRNTVTLR